MSDERILVISRLHSKLLKNSEELYKFFGSYGEVFEIRTGCSPSTKGKCIVVYRYCDGATKALKALDGYQTEKRQPLKVFVYDEKYVKSLNRKRKREAQAVTTKHNTELDTVEDQAKDDD